MLLSEHPTEEMTVRVLFSSTMEDKTDFVETNRRKYQQLACQTVGRRDSASLLQEALMLIKMDIQVSYGVIILLLHLQKLYQRLKSWINRQDIEIIFFFLFQILPLVLSKMLKHTSLSKNIRIEFSIYLCPFVKKLDLNSCET